MKPEILELSRYSERLKDIENICWGCGHTWTLRDCSWHRVKSLTNRVPGCPKCGNRVIVHLKNDHK